MKTYLDGWKRTFKFSGESTRAQFWTFGIINFIIITAAYYVMIADLVINGEHAVFINYLSIGLTIFAFFYFFASWSIAVRRLHDSGRSGWCLLLGLIPFIGWLILLVFYLSPSKY